MKSKVILTSGIDNDPEDIMNLQAFAQDGAAQVFADAVTTDRKYAGFSTTKTAATQISVLAGRLYSGGAQYDRAASYTYDFANTLPLAAKKVASIVTWGTEAETDVRAREFLINEETLETEPRTVAMELARIANLSVQVGAESADPLPPILDVGVIEVARVLLTTTGVSTITMNATNALDSVKTVAERTSALEAFKNVAEPQIVSLASDLSSLKNSASGNVSRETYGRALARLAVLEAKNGIPAAAVDSAADFFLDASASDVTNTAQGYLAKVQEGIRFADEASNVTALSIFNSLDTAVKITSGLMLPAYNREVRLAVGPATSQIGISSYTYQTNELVQKTISRQRIRYGESFTVCSNSAWWQSGQYDYETETFEKDGETFNVYNATRSVGAHDIVRVRRYWYDTYQEPYWENVIVDHTVPGSQIAETFLNANDMWLDAIGLNFTSLAATGGINLSICETDANGVPNLAKAISVTSVARENLALGETVIPIQPVFLAGGKRYAIVVISAADHYLAVTQGENFPYGTFFYSLDGAYQTGSGEIDLCFTLYACKFTKARASVQLSPLSLSGGITTLDILADTIVPGSTSLTYELQVGSVWYPVGEVDESVLGAGGNIPPLVPLRVVFVGTPDVMPALRLTGSQVTVSRPRLTLTHISTVRTLPSSSSSVRVVARLENFASGNHTAVAKLRSGSGYSTVTTASSSVDVTQPDGSIERTWLFNLGSAISSYKIQFEATSTSALIPFHFAYRKDYAL